MAYDWKAPRTKETLDSGTVLDSVLEKYGIGDQVRQTRLLTEWTEMVGAKVASHTCVRAIRNGVLIIDVDSHAWAQELAAYKDRIGAAIHKRIGDPPLFSSIQFRYADRLSRTRVDPTIVRRPRVEVAPPRNAASGAARSTIIEEASTVDDPDLRELITRVRIAHDR